MNSMADTAKILTKDQKSDNEWRQILEKTEIEKPVSGDSDLEIRYGVDVYTITSREDGYGVIHEKDIDVYGRRFGPDRHHQRCIGKFESYKQAVEEIRERL